MAKKGQKFNSYTKELKEEILSKLFNDKATFGALSREYGIPKGTIKGWAFKMRNGKPVLMDTINSRKGRPKKNPNEIDYKERYEILKKFQDFIIARREKK